MRIVGLLFAFAFGLGATAAALRSLAAYNPSASEGMLEHLAVHGGQYDLIIVGPSYVQLHFLPELFDQRMRELGHPLRSFSFGMPQMRGPEIDYYLERIFELQLPKLKWLLVDVTLGQLLTLDQPNWYKRRPIKWHEPEQFGQLPRAILNRTDRTALERASEITVHTEHLLLNLFNVGEGLIALQSFDTLGAPRIRARNEFAPRIPSEKKLRLTTRKYKRRRKWHVNLTQTLIELRKQAPKEPQSTGMIVGFRNRIRAHGVQPLFVLSPLLRDTRIDKRVPGDEPLTVLDFNDPLLYPALYNYKLRSNATHFHYYGARVYTLALADRFAAHIEGREGPPRMVVEQMALQRAAEQAAPEEPASQETEDDADEDDADEDDTDEDDADEPATDPQLEAEAESGMGGER